MTNIQDADCCRFALPHRRPSGLIFLRHRFTDPPFPGGLSFPSGDGGKKESKRQGRQATKKARPPANTTAARSTGNAGGKPPAGCLLLRFSLCRKRFNAGDARGGAPCMK